ncbi:MMPL family transporter [Nocardioides panaciterrulae]|uniref:RND superfamily putative drug exporter n=1 Tax=Nocardioides panaciterrulae TaxID=661492 RepID=A0A7Y9E3X6_9ACTN|nr:MMPL family transporter [Nocardioides panaciterrulae]NYD40781.1 RND superfamily putative drug exporter [Nocardioides panaciterrulae]
MHRQIAGKLTGRVTKWIVLVAWLVILVAVSGFAAKLTDVQNNESSSWLPASAESTRALDKLGAFQDPEAIPTVVVYGRAAGLTPADLAAAKQQVAEFQDMKGVEGKVVGPIVSKDGKAAQTLVTFNFGKNGWNQMPDTAAALRDIATIPGVAVHIAGQGGQAADSAKAFEGLDSTLLFAAGGVVILILLLTYRSPVLWILPVFSAVVALFTAQAVIYFLAKYADLTVNGQSQGILTVLVFGAGTDYALLLVARYREELRRHEDRHEAMAFALHRAAPAIVASAATVILGMLCLLFAEMNSTAGLGPVAAIGIAVALLVMITLLPALLVITGRWVFWPQRPRFGSVEPTASGLWAKVGRRIAVRPRAVWVGTAAALAVSCLGILSLNASGLTTEDSYTKDFDSIVGQRVLTAHGLVDQSSPMMVVANADRGEAVSRSLAAVSGLTDVTPPTVKDGVAYVQATITSDALSQSAFDTVAAARDAVHAVPGADALVGGYSAISLDVENASSRDNTVIIPIVLVVVLLILMVLLRAVLSPLLLIGTVVLSFGAALGLSSLLFKYVFGFAGADASLPLFVFVFLVALGIDYNIFLMTRVREETQTRGTRQGSLVALSATGGVITSAGLVLASTFLVLGTLPLVAFVEIGVAVALGVILDTMVVRSVLVTALNLDLGSRIWWPSSLDRGEHRIAPPDAEPRPEPVATR